MPIHPTFNPTVHGRHSIRLSEYDYASEEYYFITICTQDRKRLFGRIRNQKMELNGLGRIVRDELLKTSSLRPNVRMDTRVVMPDHVHFIVNIHSDANHQAEGGAWRAMPLPHDDHPPMNRAFSKYGTGTVPRRGDARVAPTNMDIVGRPKGPKCQSVGSIVGAFKSAVTKRIHSFLPDISVWQRNYYEKILFDSGMVDWYREYIRENPRNWKRDRYP